MINSTQALEQTMGRGHDYTFRETAINNKAGGKFSFEICVPVCNKPTYPTFSNASAVQNLQTFTNNISQWIYPGIGGDQENNDVN